MLAELAYWRASARYAIDRPDRIADYRNADLSEFELIAKEAPRNAIVTLYAALKVLVHKAKVGATGAELLAARARADRILDAVIPTTDDFTCRLLLSRYYRASAFVPQRDGDRDQVVSTMDLAERYAVGMAPVSEDQEVVYLENLHALFESRTKEALWLGDLDLALARVLRLAEVDPCDPKIWLELGQVRMRRSEYELGAEAYLTAAMLGHPASAIARHMAGRCFAKIGQAALAGYFFKAAVETDPHSISPHEAIQALPDHPPFAALKEWSLCSFGL